MIVGCHWILLETIPEAVGDSKLLLHLVFSLIRLFAPHALRFESPVLAMPTYSALFMSLQLL